MIMNPISKKKITAVRNSFKPLKPIRRSARLKNNQVNSNFNNIYNKNLLNYESNLTLHETESPKPGCHIQQLPNEILLHIFKFVNRSDLWFNVKLVCRQWEELSKSSCLWETIVANENVPTYVLQGWLNTAPLLKNLKLFGRKDADIIIEQVSKCNRQLENIEVRNCWGSSFRRNVKSKPLCNLLRRCRMLSDINLDGTSFVSCKFYTLIARAIPSPSKRRKSLDTKYAKMPINFSGYASSRQIKAFLLSHRMNANHLASSLPDGDEFVERFMKLNKEIKIIHEDSPFNVPIENIDQILEDMAMM